MESLTHCKAQSVRRINGWSKKVTERNADKGIISILENEEKSFYMASLYLQRTKNKMKATLFRILETADYASIIS